MSMDLSGLAAYTADIRAECEVEREAAYSHGYGDGLAVAKEPDLQLLTLAIQRAEDGYIGYGWPDAETHAEAIVAEYRAMLNAPSADEVRGILSEPALGEQP